MQIIVRNLPDCPMNRDPGHFREFSACLAREHRHNAIRMAGESGVRRAGTPVAASRTLGPALSASCTIFAAGCNFKFRERVRLAATGGNGACRFIRPCPRLPHRSPEPARMRILCAVHYQNIHHNEEIHRMVKMDCRLKEQGFSPGSCAVRTQREKLTACTAALRESGGKLERLIHALHLSRPENYFSIYQSGCNMSCRKCHSWQFSQIADGTWMSPEVVLGFALAYEKGVTLWEPRQKATAWHAQESCRCCGACVLYGERSMLCPAVLPRESIVLSPQGHGPARNILAFTGGDVMCRPEFYGRSASLVKEKTRLWVLLETNGFGLTAQNLDYLRDSGVDAFWLDIKAFDPDKHKWLTGCDNDRILGLPEQILARGFVLEVLSLYIPGLVEADQLTEIARMLARSDPKIPFTILAFFPEYKMRDFRPPSLTEMVKAYEQVTAAGLTSVRLGNLGQFVRTDEDLRYLLASLDGNAF